jgi:hypothetical protein
MNHVENRMDPLCTKVGGARVSMAELARAVALHRSTLSSQIRSTRIGLCSPSEHLQDSRFGSVESGFAARLPRSMNEVPPAVPEKLSSLPPQS